MSGTRVAGLARLGPIRLVLSGGHPRANRPRRSCIWSQDEVKSDTMIHWRRITGSTHRWQRAFSNCSTQFSPTPEIKSEFDQIGPPHRISNLRQYKLHRPQNESPLHRRYRELREDTFKWSHQFWQEHNEQFTNERAEFIKKLLRDHYPDEPDKSTISAREMSVFYKNFLDKKWSSHLKFNWEWQKRNFSIVCLSLLVRLEALKGSQK
eukprot:TCALIF_12221-PA protein Name:"Similar to Apopt1 Apoptogenic protein 1, mitochondrial (Mus musculus)" AED:0.00 eAED:0.00 QI:315/1/1/1/1/1/3/2929/207